IAGDVSEGDLVPARAPFRSRGAAPEETDSALVAAIGIHHIELLAARTIAFEHDLRAVGRIAAANVDAGAVGQAAAFTALGRHAIDVGIAADGHGIEDPL